MYIYCELESDFRSTVSAWLVVMERTNLCPVMAENSKVMGCDERKVSFSVTFGYSVKELKVRR